MRFKMFLTVLGLMGVGLLSAQASIQPEDDGQRAERIQKAVAEVLEQKGTTRISHGSSSIVSLAFETTEGIFYNNSQGPSFYGRRSLGSPYGLGGFEGSIHVPYNHWFGGGQGVAHPVTEEEKGQR
jgi:hypothetical protein